MAIGCNFVTVSLVCLAVWLAWYFGAFGLDPDYPSDTNTWFDDTNRQRFYEDAECGHTAWDSSTVTSETVGGVAVCLAAWLLVHSPLMLFAVLLFLGVFLLFLSHTQRASATRFTARLFAGFVAIAVFGMYSAASLGGGDMGLSNAAFAIFGVVLLAVIMLCLSTIGLSRVKTATETTIRPFARRNPSAVTLLLMTFVLASPMYALFLLLSAANQAVRKLFDRCCSCCGGGPTKRLDAEDVDERALVVTLAAHKANRLLSQPHLNWTKAISWAQIFVILWWGFKYGTIVTNIGANALIGALASLSCAAVAALFALIGTLGFSDPDHPGPRRLLDRRHPRRPRLRGRARRPPGERRVQRDPRQRDPRQRDGRRAPRPTAPTATAPRPFSTR